MPQQTLHEQFISAEAYEPMDEAQEGEQERRMFGYTSDGSVGRGSSGSDSDDDDSDSEHSEAGNVPESRAKLIERIRAKISDEMDESGDESGDDGEASDSENRADRAGAEKQALRAAARFASNMSALPTDAITVPFLELPALKPSNELVAIGRVKSALGGRRLVVETTTNTAVAVAAVTAQDAQSASQDANSALAQLLMPLKRKKRNGHAHRSAADGAASSSSSSQPPQQPQQQVLPLDVDTVLFLSADQPLGKIGDVFGPVQRPFYMVFFSSEEELRRTLAQADASLLEQVDADEANAAAVATPPVDHPMQPLPTAQPQESSDTPDTKHAQPEETDASVATPADQPMPSSPPVRPQDSTDAFVTVAPSEQQARIPAHVPARKYRVALDDAYFSQHRVSVFIEKPNGAAVPHVFDSGLTKIINMAEISQAIGSDASWKDDVEVPEHLQDYSDDEEESRARKRRKISGYGDENGDDEHQDTATRDSLPGAHLAPRRGGRGGRGGRMFRNASTYRPQQFSPFSEGAYYAQDGDMFDSAFAASSAVPPPAPAPAQPAAPA